MLDITLLVANSEIVEISAGDAVSGGKVTLSGILSLGGKMTPLVASAFRRDVP